MGFWLHFWKKKDFNDMYSCKLYIIFHTDIDECAQRIDHCRQNCHNTLGSYTCSCNSGFQILDVDGRTCDGECIKRSLHIHWSTSSTDIDECSNGTHSCVQMCNNTHGAYHCLCRDGYELESDGFSCEGRSTLIMLHKIKWIIMMLM